MSKESVKAAEREPESKGLNYRRVTELPEFDYANKLEEGRFREGMEELWEACWALGDGMGRAKAMAYFSRHCEASIVSIVRLPGSAVTCFLSITVAGRRQGHPWTGGGLSYSLLPSISTLCCPVFRAS